MTISAIKEALKSSNVSVLRDDPDNQDLPIEDNGDLPDEGRGMKCHFRIKIFKAWKMKKHVEEKARDLKSRQVPWPP